MRLLKRRKVTQKWLDEMFRPIRTYLHEHYPEDAEKMVEYLMFMGQYDGRFEYKNCITRDRIVVDMEGNLQLCGPTALKYEFEEEGERVDFTGLYIHPNVERWIQEHLKKRECDEFGEAVRILLQRMVGPRLNFDFTALRAGDPLRKNKRSLFLYLEEPGWSYVFYFLGSRDYDYRETQSRLVCAGWRPLYIDRGILERQSVKLEQWIERVR